MLPPGGLGLRPTGLLPPLSPRFPFLLLLFSVEETAALVLDSVLEGWWGFLLHIREGPDVSHAFPKGTSLRDPCVNAQLDAVQSW